MTHEQEVAMKVNPQKWVESLKYSFTNKTTVLSELMQNARRAGFFNTTGEKHENHKHTDRKQHTS